jgi:tetratricopeptide (TPR) repeat protein
MAETVNLFDELLSRAQRLQEASRWREALALLRRLAGFADLPPLVAAQVQARQGEILLKRRYYHSAAKHLVAALHLDADNARVHFLLALTLHTDPEGDKVRAWRHYRRSLELAPAQVRCRGEAGLLAIELGLTDEGLAMLRQAAEQAAGEAGAIGRLARGLCQAGKPDEALAVVQRARFQQSRCPRLRKLWTDLQLARIRRDQQVSSAQESDEGPVLLPFIPSRANLPRRTIPIRQDEPALLPGPHLVRSRSRPGRRAP